MLTVVLSGQLFPRNQSCNHVPVHPGAPDHGVASVKYAQSVRTAFTTQEAERVPIVDAQVVKSPSASLISTNHVHTQSNFKKTLHAHRVFSTLHSLQILSAYNPVSSSQVCVDRDPEFVPKTKY
jgi:hypothetical protein